MKRSDSRILTTHTFYVIYWLRVDRYNPGYHPHVMSAAQSASAFMARCLSTIPLKTPKIEYRTS